MSGLSLSGALTVAKFLALRSGEPDLAALVKGADLGEEMKAAEWVLYALSELRQSVLARAHKPALFHLNAQLASRVLLVGCKAPTLADLFVFCALRRGPLHAEQDLAELAPLSHLVRWFDYVQGSPVGAATREEGEEPRVRACAFLSCLVVSPRW